MNYIQGTTEHEIYTMLAAGFCERWPATHEREGLAGGLRARVWLFKEKNLPLTVNGFAMAGFRITKL